MSGRQAQAGSRESASPGVPRLLPFLAMLGTVFGVLVLGAILRTRAERGTAYADPPGEGRRPARAQTAWTPPSGSPVRPPAPERVAPAPTETHAVSPGPAEEPVPDEQAPPPEAEPAPRAATAGTEPHEGIESRAAQDRERLDQPGPGWTAQVLVLCERSSVERLIATHDSGSDLYLLPAMVKGRACWAVCWGRYDSKEEALRAADRPAGLGSGDAHPRALAEALR